MTFSGMLPLLPTTGWEDCFSRVAIPTQLALYLSHILSETLTAFGFVCDMPAFLTASMSFGPNSSQYFRAFGKKDRLEVVVPEIVDWTGCCIYVHFRHPKICLFPNNNQVARVGESCAKNRALSMDGNFHVLVTQSGLKTAQ